MPIFRGSKDATVSTGDIVATQADIAAAVTLAEQAQAASEAAQAAAEAALDNFDDRYLGAKSSDPTVDNDGDPLIDGALYYNTSEEMTKVYDLSSDTWSDLKPSATEQTNINTVAGIAGDVTTVASIETDVTTVSGISGDVTTVSGISSDVTTVSGISSDVTAVADDSVDIGIVATDLDGSDTIGTVAGSIASVNTVAAELGAGQDVTIVADNITDVNTVATNITDVNTVAGIDSNVTTVAGISSDVTTVSGISLDVSSVADINSDVTTVSGISSDVTTVSGISSDVTTTASISSDITIVADNLADITNFADVYIGPAASDPSLRNDGSALQDGDLYFNTTDDRLKVYDGAAWQVTARLDSEIRGLFSAGGDLTYNSTTGEFSVTTYKSTDFDTDFATKTTDDLTEGSTNLYYADSLVDSHLTGGTGVTYSSGTISIGQDVGTGASVTFLDAEFTGTGAVELPEGTEAQRPGTPAAGMIRFNSDVSSFEGYDGSAWGEIGGGGGATGGGGDQVFVENDQVVTTDYTIPADKNASSVGPIEVQSGVTVTVSTGARWVVI